MSETEYEKENVIQNQIIVLYLDGCQYVSKIKNLLLQNQKQEAKYIFIKFRENFINMYYLSRSIKNVKDDEIMIKIKNWCNIKTSNQSIKYMLYSISLFEELTNIMIDRGDIIG